MSGNSINKSILIGGWCLISLLFGFMYYYSPLLCEDLHFQVIYRLFNNNESGFSLSGWLAFIEEIRNYDNSRLANILTFFSTIWKPFNYLFPWFTGMAVASIIFMAVKYGFGKQSTWSSIGVMWIAIAVFIPWRDGLFIRDYALNYIWTAFFTLLAIWLIMRTAAQRKSRLEILLSLIIVMFAAGWHEGFMIPTFGGLMIIASIRRFRMSVEWWILTGCYLISGLCFALSPGILNRIRCEVGNDFHFAVTRAQYFYSMIPICIVIATLCCCFFRRSRLYLSDLFKNTLFPLFITITIIGLFISFFVRFTPRVLFYPILTALICATMLLRDSWNRISSNLRGLVGTVCFALCFAQLSYATVWQRRYLMEYNYVLNAAIKSKTGTIALNSLTEQKLPFCLLGYTSNSMWRDSFNTRSFAKLLNRDFFAVIPEEIKDFRKEEAESLSPATQLKVGCEIHRDTTNCENSIGTEKCEALSPEEELFLYKGYILADPDSCPEWKENINRIYVKTAYYPDGYKNIRRNWAAIYFVTASGDTMLYIPHPPKFTTANLVGLSVE